MVWTKAVWDVTSTVQISEHLSVKHNIVSEISQLLKNLLPSS